MPSLPDSLHRLFQKLGFAKSSRINVSREAERIRNQNILKGTHAGTWDWDIVTGKLIINQRWAEIIGYTLPELTPITVDGWERSVHPDDLKLASVELEKHFSKEIDYYDVQFRQKHKDGNWRWVHARGQVIQWSRAGKPEHMSGTHMDITERKETDLRLAESQQMLRTILDNVPIRVFWKDLDCKFLGSNQLFTDDMGLDNVDDLIGMDDFDFSTEEAAKQFQKDDLEIMNSKERRLDYEENQKLKDGTIQWLRASKLPLVDHKGKVIGVLGTYEDITAVKKVQRELIHAKNEAEAANAAKDDFLAVMSHEMRTPLNPIIGYADILLQTCNTEPESTYIETIQSAANRQLQLINDILDYMGMYRSKVTPSTEPFNIFDLCELVLFDAKVSAKGLELKFKNGIHGNPVPNDLSNDSDLMMLRRVLENLIGNACKYTRKGSITLSISQDTKNTKLYLIKVEDTGIGIDAETLTRLFDPFSQGESSYTRSYEGAGLGLAICKKLTEILGGEISVESTPEKGSCFTLEMPFKIEEEGFEQHSMSAAHSLPIFSQEFDTLIVEDKPENAQIAQTMIKMMGGRCKHAQNGEEAIQICSKKKFDVILMDLSMPVMNGIDAAIALRKNPNPNQKTPIIAVTADVSQRAKHESENVGMDGYVSKPINSMLLYKAIEEGIAAQSAQDS